MHAFVQNENKTVQFNGWGIEIIPLVNSYSTNATHHILSISQRILQCVPSYGNCELHSCCRQTEDICIKSG